MWIVKKYRLFAKIKNRGRHPSFQTPQEKTLKHWTKVIKKDTIHTTKLLNIDWKNNYIYIKKVGEKQKKSTA